MHKVVQVALVLLGFCALLVRPVVAENRCSLKVRVLSPEGQRLPAAISVQEQSLVPHPRALIVGARVGGRDFTRCRLKSKLVGHDARTRREKLRTFIGIQ